MLGTRSSCKTIPPCHRPNFSYWTACRSILLGLKVAGQPLADLLALSFQLFLGSKLCARSWKILRARFHIVSLLTVFVPLTCDDLIMPGISWVNQKLSCICIAAHSSLKPPLQRYGFSGSRRTCPVLRSARSSTSQMWENHLWSRWVEA